MTPALLGSRQAVTLFTLRKARAKAHWRFLLCEVGLSSDQELRRDKLLGYLEADPENYPLLCELGDLCLQLGDRERAGPLLEKAAVMHKDDPGALYRLAVFLYGEQAWERSLQLTQQVLDLGQQHPAVRYQHVLALVRLARFEEAEAYLATLIEEKAEFPDLPHLYIRALHFQGKLEEAEKFAEVYVQDHPDDSIANGMLSLLYLDNENFDSARTLAHQVLSANPNNLDALLTAGSTALVPGTEDEACTHFENAVEQSPKNGRAWLGLGLAGMLQADMGKARRYLEKAVQYMPEHLGSWNTLAWVQIVQQDLDAAEKSLQAALEQNRNFGETYGGLAVIAAMRGNWPDAKVLAEKAVRLQPDSFSGRYAQSLVMANRGKTQQASAMLSAMLDNFKAHDGSSLLQLVSKYAEHHQGKRQKDDQLH